MRSKPISLVAAAAASALLFAACTNSPANDAPTTQSGSTADAEPASGVVTWAGTASDKAAVDAVAAAFEEKTGIKVETTIADTDNYQTTLRTQLSNGTAPDVFFVWGGDGNPMTVQTIAPGGFLEDLSDWEFVKEIPDGFTSVTKWDDKTWIAPISGAGIGAIYNMTAMDENGWEVPETWGEVMSLCTEAQDAGKSLFALGMATGWNTQLIAYALASTLVYGPEPDFAERMMDGEATFVDSAWVDVFDQYKEMEDNGCFQPDSLGTSYEDALTLVSQGEAMASVQVNASLAAMSQEAPEDTEWSLRALPATNDTSDTQMPAALGAGMGINAQAKNPEGARALVEFLVSDEGQTLYSTAISGIPILPAPSFELDPALEELDEFLEAGRTAPFMDQLWPNARVQQTLFEVLQQLFAGQKDAVEGLTEMDEAYQQG